MTSDENQMEKILNFRQVPGTRLYRCARPDNATEADFKLLTDTYNIRSIVDFRSKPELIKGGSSELSVLNHKYEFCTAKRRGQSSQIQTNLIKNQNNSWWPWNWGSTSHEPQGQSHPNEVTSKGQGQGQEHSNGVPNQGETESQDHSSNVTTSNDQSRDQSKEVSRRHYIMDLTGKAFGFKLFRRLSIQNMVYVAFYEVLPVDSLDKQTEIVGAMISDNGLLQLYKDTVDNCPSTLCTSLHLLCQPENIPAAVCCHLGKDRTGMMCMLVSSVIGRSQEEIVQDYVETQGKFAGHEDEIALHLKIKGITNPGFMEAKPETMQGLLEHIQNKYGSVIQYLDHIGFKETDRQRLRENLVITNPQEET